MRRREFITLLGGAAAWPLPLCAQQATKVPRIGFLRHGAAAANAEPVEAMRTGLRQLGYVEGKSIVIEFRWAETVEHVRLSSATEFGPHRMSTSSSRPASTEVELRRERRPRRSPSCSPSMTDPVGLGHVASLPRPGRQHHRADDANDRPFVGRQASWRYLKEAVPRHSRIAVLLNPDNRPRHVPAVQAVKAAGRKARGCAADGARAKRRRFRPAIRRLRRWYQSGRRFPRPGLAALFLIPRIALDHEPRS